MRLHRALAIFSASVTAACASVGGMRSAPLDEGVVRHYETDLRTATLASRNALAGSQLEIEEVTQLNETTWSIIAKRSSGAWTYGELIRIVCEEISEGDVAIRILTRRRGALNITAKGDWSEELFSQIALELNALDETTDD